MVRSKQTFKENNHKEKFSPQCCSKNCVKKFPGSDAVLIQENFQKFEYQARVAFIRRCIQEESPMNRDFFLFGLPVCRQFFLDTLKISMQVVRLALEKWKNEDTSDKRGRHGNHAILSEAKRQAVISHIKSFPKYCSHYARESSSASYLDPSLNVAIMHRLFVSQWFETHDENSNDFEQKCPSIFFYNQIFVALGYKFKPLKTDTCKLCDALNNKISYAINDEEKSKFKEILDEHHRTAENVRQEMRNDLERAKNEKSIRTMVIDLQKVLILPKASINVLFYTRNYNCYNLGIHENGNGHFNFWTETDGGRGAREVGSCIIKHLEDTWDNDTEEIILWGDSCGGQNRNHIVAIMLAHFLASKTDSKLKKISFKFLISGHSFNLCDSDFGIFEKCIRKQKFIMTPQEYTDLMMKCKPENPFKVTVMTHKLFKDPSDLLKNITKRDFDKNSKDQVSWIKSREFMLDAQSPFSIFLRYNFHDNYYELNYGKIKRARGIETIVSKGWSELSLKLLYPDGKSISEAKKKDLIKIAQYLPPNGQRFIEEITQRTAANFLDDVDGLSLQDIEDLPELIE